MEVPSKKTRAPKATVKQVEFLVDYMQNHIAFATGKLLGARGKATNDLQWQSLCEKLNTLEGASKSVEGWKKVYSQIFYLFISYLAMSYYYFFIYNNFQLWCDQRNHARARAAKAKTNLRKTGNTTDKINLKDLDLKILSILGGESSVGLPIMEQGFEERPEDIIDPAIIFEAAKDTTVTTQETEQILAIEEGAVVFPLSPTPSSSVQNNIENELCNELPEQNLISISAATSESILQTPKISKRILVADNTIISKTSKKRRLSSSLDKVADQFQNTQEKHVEGLHVIYVLTFVDLKHIFKHVYIY